MNPYQFIIAASSVIILSFLFNILAKKTSIPSVLMLILLGVVIQFTLWRPDLSAKDSNIMTILEVIGNVGLIFIVLEAALDLELKKEKRGLIIKSFFVALIALLGSSFLIAGFIMLLWSDVSLFKGLIYGVPLSIMSSAIIIPSVSALRKEKREFMIYESTFSDILGIMFFYFLKDNGDATSMSQVAGGVVLNVIVTVVIAVVASYLLVSLFQQINMHAKYFLTFASLMLLYALGKSFHLSSLLIILFFGLVLNNSDLFFPGKFRRFAQKDKMKNSLHELHVITLETAFVLRTFFFVIFGITISLSSLIDFQVAGISIIIVLILYLVRFVSLKLFLLRDILPQQWIAPRGLITVLLFYAIPNGMVNGHGDILPEYKSSADYTIWQFDQGILLYTILITSLVMTVAMIMNSGSNLKEALIETIKLKPVEPNFLEKFNSENDRESTDDAHVDEPQ